MMAPPRHKIRRISVMARIMYRQSGRVHAGGDVWWCGYVGLGAGGETHKLPYEGCDGFPGLGVYSAKSFFTYRKVSLQVFPSREGVVTYHSESQERNPYERSAKALQPFAATVRVPLEICRQEISQ